MKTRATKKQIEGVTQAVTSLISNKNLRDNFLKKPAETLESVGVKFQDPKTEKAIVSKLKDAILKDMNFTRVGVDPGVAAIDVGATVATGVITGVVTGATTGVVNYTVSDLVSDRIRTRVVLDYTKINALVEKDFKVKGRL